MGKTKTAVGTSAISLAYSAFFEFLFDRKRDKLLVMANNRSLKIDDY